MNAHNFLSEDWVEAVRHAINNSTPYREAARNWEGDFYFVIEPDVRGAEPPVFIYVDLWHGECRASNLANDEAGHAPEFRISGSRKNWKRVLRKDIDPIKALMTNALRLKGNMVKVMRNVKAAQELVNAVGRVETTYD